MQTAIENHDLFRTLRAAVLNHIGASPEFGLINPDLQRVVTNQPLHAHIEPKLDKAQIECFIDFLSGMLQWALSYREGARRFHIIRNMPEVIRCDGMASNNTALTSGHTPPLSIRVGKYCDNFVAGGMSCPPYPPSLVVAGVLYPSPMLDYTNRAENVQRYLNVCSNHRGVSSGVVGISGAGVWSGGGFSSGVVGMSGSGIWSGGGFSCREIGTHEIIELRKHIPTPSTESSANDLSENDKEQTTDASAASNGENDELYSISDLADCFGLPSEMDNVVARAFPNMTLRPH